MADVSEITEYLYVSGYTSIQPKVLRDFGITCVINTAAEVPDLKTYNFNFPLEYLHVEMYDHESADLLSYLDSCVDKIHHVQQNGGRTLVHCLGGVSRSVSVCAGYLIKYCGMSFEKAMRRIHRVRPQANPNPGFCEQLGQYERFFTNYNENNS